MLLNNRVSFEIFGEKFQKMQSISFIHHQTSGFGKGALMPDAHFGYGLPIGGVLATKMP